MAEGIQTLDLETQMGEVGGHGDGAAARKAANLEQFVAVRRFKKNEFGTARGFLPADLDQTEDVGIKLDRAFEIFDAVASVIELCHCHGRNHSPAAGKYNIGKSPIEGDEGASLR